MTSEIYSGNNDGTFNSARFVFVNGLTLVPASDYSADLCTLSLVGKTLILSIFF